MSWGETLDQQKSALRWDIKRSLNNLCKKLSDIGEECFVVTVNVSNGWVGHMGSIRGNEYINQKTFIPYDFLEYCSELEERTLGRADQASDVRSDDDDMEEDSMHSQSDKEDDSTMVSISRYDSDSSTENFEDQESNQVSGDTKNTDDEKEDELHEQRSKTKPQKKINSKQQKTQSEMEERQNQDTTAVYGARIHRDDGNLSLFCSVCLCARLNQSAFKEHIKSRSHLFKSQAACRCFKCLTIFDSMFEMFEHVKLCDLSAAFTKLVNTDYVKENLR